MAAKLSPKMQALVDHMKATGQPLRRWPGGWWGTAGSPTRVSVGFTIPCPDFPTNTVHALEARGVIKRAERRPMWWQDDFVLTGAA